MTTVTIELPEATAAMQSARDTNALVCAAAAEGPDGSALATLVSNPLHIAGTAGPVYRAIHEHFTLSGRDLGEAFGDSFVRALAAIDDELNDARITRSSKAV